MLPPEATVKGSPCSIFPAPKQALEESRQGLIFFAHITHLDRALAVCAAVADTKDLSESPIPLSPASGERVRVRGLAGPFS